MDFITRTYAALSAIVGRLNGLKIAVDALIAAPSGGGELTVTTAPIYEYREISAEEASGLGPGAEWSMGNGATGYMGLTHDGKEGWEVYAMYFNADTYASGTTGIIEFMLYKTAGNAVDNVIASIDIGGLVAGHASKYVEFDTPLPVEAIIAPLGFYTRSITGSASDTRVGAMMRRKIGEYVKDVQLAPQAATYNNTVIRNNWEIQPR